MQNPKVSVIVPVYNGEKFIAGTIQMLLNSTLHDIEIIAIDDGSKDKSADICRNIAIYDQRVKVVCQDNSGVSGARNQGLLLARGDYICFCDQDDVIESRAYEEMYEKAQEYNCDVIMSGTGKLIGDRREIFERLPNAFFTGEEIRNNCMMPILFNGTYCYSAKNGVRLENDIWKCMIKREFIIRNGLTFRRFVNYEDDFIFLLDVLARAQRLVTVADILYYWRVNLGSETYNTAYVENLYEKDIQLQHEIISIMQIAKIDILYIDMYNKFQNCNRYIHLIENVSRSDGKKLGEKIAYLKRIQYEPEFRESVNFRNKFKKNLIHRKIVLALVDKGFFGVAWLFHNIYSFVRKKGLLFRWWTRVENYLYIR